MNLTDQEFFLEWWNNYLTVGKIAEDYGISEAEAMATIERGKISNHLEYLRKEIRAERISMGEITELQSLADHIDESDVELLQWAGVPENKT